MKISRIGIIAAALALGTTAASAGGFVSPSVEVTEPVVAVTPERTWEGAYGGVTLGYAWQGDDRVGIDNGQPSGVYTPGDLNLKGGTVGLRLGYRWQRAFNERQVVFGGELGYERPNIKDSFTAGGYNASSEVDSVLALRAKTGLLSKDGQTLYYGIQGIARGSFDYVVSGAGGGTTMAYDDNLSKTGYILGIGVERRLTDRLSVTGELERAVFGKTTLTDANGATTQATPKYDAVKLGLNFRF